MAACRNSCLMLLLLFGVAFLAYFCYIGYYNNFNQALSVRPQKMNWSLCFEVNLTSVPSESMEESARQSLEKMTAENMRNSQWSPEFTRALFRYFATIDKIESDPDWPSLRKSGDKNIREFFSENPKENSEQAAKLILERSRGFGISDSEIRDALFGNRLLQVTASVRQGKYRMELSEIARPLFLRQHNFGDLACYAFEPDFDKLEIRKEGSRPDQNTAFLFLGQPPAVSGALFPDYSVPFGWRKTIRVSLQRVTETDHCPAICDQNCVLDSISKNCPCTPIAINGDCTIEKYRACLPTWTGPDCPECKTRCQRLQYKIEHSASDQIWPDGAHSIIIVDHGKYGVVAEESDKSVLDSSRWFVVGAAIIVLSLATVLVGWRKGYQRNNVQYGLA